MANGSGGPPQTTGDPGGGDLMDGFGDGDAEFQEVIDNLGRVFDAVKGPVGIAWLACAFVPFVFVGMSAAIRLVSAAAASSTGGVGGLIAMLAVPIDILGGLAGFLAAVLQWTLYRPLRGVLFGKRNAMSWTDALRDGFGRFVPVLLGMLIIGVGIVLTCGLGVFVCWLVLLGPYLLAIHDDIELGDAFMEGFEQGKAYWKVLLPAFGAVVVVGLISGCMISAANFAASMVGGPVGGAISEMLFWGIQTAIQFVAFVAMGSAFLVVDEHEGL